MFSGRWSCVPISFVLLAFNKISFFGNETVCLWKNSIFQRHTICIFQQKGHFQNKQKFSWKGVILKMKNDSGYHFIMRVLELGHCQNKETTAIPTYMGHGPYKVYYLVNSNIEHIEIEKKSFLPDCMKCNLQPHSIHCLTSNINGNLQCRCSTCHVTDIENKMNEKNEIFLKGSKAYCRRDGLLL